MKTETIAIVDHGRRPQFSTSRITVLDVFYYLHRGYDFDFTHQAMPSLTREEFDAVVAYVNAHHDELVEQDRRAEEFHKERMAAQHAKGGIFAAADENLTTEERVARLKRKLAEKNGAHHPD
jgi:hypothetical protein